MKDLFLRILAMSTDLTSANAVSVSGCVPANIGETERQASEFATLPLARNLFPFPDAHRKVRKLEIGIDCP